MPPQTLIRIAAILGATAVALGAFGAHGLADMLTETGRLDVWKTAALYHLAHAVVLLALGLSGKPCKLPALLILIGTLIFSGSLYALCLTQVGVLGAITPIGGTLLIAGWLALLTLKSKLV